MKKFPGTVKTAPMKRVPPPLGSKAPMPVSKVDNTEALVEALRTRVNELEERLAALESVITRDNDDVVINSTKGVVIQAMTNFEVNASTAKLSAGFTETNTGLAKFTGMVQCDTIQAQSVIASSYTPGAGNTW